MVAPSEEQSIGQQSLQLETTETAPDPPYSIFTPRQKKLIVFWAGTAGIFSPLTGSIYYPVLTVLARDYHVSNALINLTVTTYLVRANSNGPPAF